MHSVTKFEPYLISVVLCFVLFCLNWIIVSLCIYIQIYFYALFRTDIWRVNIWSSEIQWIWWQVHHILRSLLRKNIILSNCMNRNIFMESTQLANTLGSTLISIRHLRVCSVWNRHRSEGLCYLNISTNTGEIVLICTGQCGWTWWLLAWRASERPSLWSQRLGGWPIVRCKLPTLADTIKLNWRHCNVASYSAKCCYQGHKSM